jgi:hypothetical protein
MDADQSDLDFFGENNDPAKVIEAVGAAAERLAGKSEAYRNLFLGLAQEAANREVI